MKLMARFKQQIEGSPAMADPRPLGSGPPNHHGMPQLPIGQTETDKWPVLDLGVRPKVKLDAWELAIDGAVEEKLVLSWKDFLALEQVDDVSDFHCVTTWSRMNLAWRGVRFSAL